MTVVGKGTMVGKSLAAMLSAAALMGGVASAQQPDSQDDLRLRAQIVTMETALKQAVYTGAKHLAQEFLRASPVADGVRVETMLVSSPKVEGFVLNPHGMVFVVRVPSMNANISWALVVTGRQQRLTRNGAPAQAVAAQSVGGAPPPADATAPPASPVLDSEALTDPEGAYRRFVKEELTRTMLESSGALRIAPDQYLSVAAHRDSPPNPLVPGDDGRTVTFTVKGSDLAAYYQNRLSLQDAMKRVTIEER